MKKASFLILILVLFAALPLCCSAYEVPGAEDYITPEIEDALPDGISDKLKSEDSFTGPGIDEVLAYGADIARQLAAPAVLNFLRIIGIVLICSCLSMLSGLTESDAAAGMYRFLASLCLALMIFAVLKDLWEQLNALLAQLNTLMNSVTAVTATVYALSGNITAAAVNSTQMMIVMTVIEDICYYGTYPVLQVCFGMSFISCISESVDLSSVAALIRKTFTAALVILMSVMTAVLSFQNTLAEAGDTLAVRTVKLASGSFVPIVGNAVGEATKTVAAGMGALKGSLGVICIFALCATVLPLFISLWINKLSFLLGGAISDMLGLKTEGSFLRSSGELLDFAIAILASISLLFIINLMIFAKSAVVIGG